MNRSRERFVDNRFLQLALGCYVVFWIALAIRPLDRSDWFLENLLVLATLSVLIPTYRRFQLSNLSYALILVFLAFHGTAYLGTQGDIWDAQKDMAAAFIGAIIVALWLMLRQHRAMLWSKAPFV